MTWVTHRWKLRAPTCIFTITIQSGHLLKMQHTNCWTQPIFTPVIHDVYITTIYAPGLYFYRAMHMHKRGICCHRVSVRPSVTFVSCAKTNKNIFEIFSPSGSTIWYSSFSVRNGVAMFRCSWGNHAKC